MGAVIDDLRFALRQIHRRPGLTGAAVLTLGLGIGATTTVFSVFDAVVLQPLPYPDAHRLVRLRETSPEGASFSVSEANFLDFRDQSQSFTDLGAVQPSPLTLVGTATPLSSGGSVGEDPAGAPPERLLAFEASAGLFAALGVAPALGRPLLPRDEEPGSAGDAVLLGHGVWKRRFGSDPEILGRTLRFDGSTRQVVGIMPPGFDFPFGAEAWIPMAPGPEHPRGDHRLEVFGRLAPGVSLEQASAELDAVALRLAELYPDSNAGWGTELLAFPEWLIGPRVTRVNSILLSAASLLLLLACANVSNLLLAQASARQREMEVRVALGASRSRIVRQLLTESALLGFLGAAAGLLLVFWSISWIRRLEYEALPRIAEADLGGTALAVTLGVSLLAAFLFGMAPAVQAAGPSRLPANGGERITTRRGLRLRDLLVVAEVALAMVLLIGSGLFLQSLRGLVEADPGFDPEAVLAVDLSLPADRYPELSPQVGALYRELLERIEALPGVVAAGATMVHPFGGLNPANFVAASEQSEGGNGVIQIRWRSVTPGYFHALGVTLLSGRLFDASDRLPPEAFQAASQPPLSAVVSRSLAARLWGEESALGRRILWGGEADGMDLRVVGVVGDLQDVRLGHPPEPLLFFTHDQVPWPHMTLVIKAAGDPSSIAGGVRQSLHELDPELAVAGLAPLADDFAESLAEPRLSAWLLAGFAAVALLLAYVGIFGLVSFAVALRTREIAIRMTVGATAGTVVRLILRHGLLLAAAGIGLGSLGALALSRFAASLLYEVGPTDPVTYSGVALMLGAAAALATLRPALRAAGLDPGRAMAGE